VNIKAFFVDALASALELGIGTPDDVLRHVTPDVLANNLPRPLWARLLTACLGAPKVDARLVVETVGVANLCEHVPATIIWTCIAEMGTRSIGKAFEAATPSPMISRTTQPMRSTSSVLSPPPEPVAKPTPASGTPVQLGPSIPRPTPAKGVATQPVSGLVGESSEGESQPPSRARSPSQRFRQSGTGVRTLGGVARRPQAAAVPVVKPIANASKRVENNDYETETAVESADWREKEIVVDDEQLVDWQADPGSAVAITGDDDFSDIGGRKR